MAKLIILVGLPGSGKSTYAKSIMDPEGQLQYCSSDKIREELYGDENIQGDPNKVFRVLHNKVKNLLDRGYDVIYDATNVTRKNRRSIIQEVKKYCDEIEAHIIWAPVGQCISRDRDRKRSVGEDVIRKFLHRWQSPFYDEGFTKIKVVHNTNINFDPINFRNMMIENMKIPHDNPHHTLGVWEHCQATAAYVNDKFTDIAVREAAPIHDVGKPWVKGFESDETGKMLPIAHYYQHHCVGGYLVYGMYDLVAEKPAEAVAIVVSWLVSNHMEPFFDSKYYRNLQPELKKLIDELHEADVAAH